MVPSWKRFHVSITIIMMPLNEKIEENYRNSPCKFESKNVKLHDADMSVYINIIMAPPYGYANN